MICSDNWKKALAEASAFEWVRKSRAKHHADHFVTIDAEYDLKSINPNRWSMETRWKLYRARAAVHELERALAYERLGRDPK